MNTAPEHHRVPDVVVLDRANPREEIVTAVPLAVFEVLSPHDKVQDLYEKLDEHTAMGIPQIRVVDLKTGVCKRYVGACLKPANRLSCAGRGIDFAVQEIATLL